MLQSRVLIFTYLKYESGVHRVQRVPDTETQGRVILAELAVLGVEEIDVKIEDKDLRIDVLEAVVRGQR